MSDLSIPKHLQYMHFPRFRCPESHYPSLAVLISPWTPPTLAAIVPSPRLTAVVPAVLKGSSVIPLTSQLQLCHMMWRPLGTLDSYRSQNSYRIYVGVPTHGCFLAWNNGITSKLAASTEMWREAIHSRESNCGKKNPGAWGQWAGNRHTSPLLQHFI